MLLVPDLLCDQVAIFFIAKDLLLFHSCSLAEAEAGGDFLDYPDSHDNVWRRKYQAKYQVDYDYFPRGRIIFNKAKNVYWLYHDACITKEAGDLQRRYPPGKCSIFLDDHYQCHRCNKFYVS